MKTILWINLVLICLGISAEALAQGVGKRERLKLGAERLDVVTGLLKDKKVGLVVNQTSILEDRQVHLLDALLAEGIDVKKVFAPEHGFRGTVDAGEEVFVCS